MFCKNCGVEISDKAAICVKCGVANSPIGDSPNKRKRVVYVLFAVFLGLLGIHNFYAGRKGPALTQLLVTLLIGWTVIPLLVISIWVLVEICTVVTDGAGNPFI
jgi:TM2 domain-containing membrane protein YozV